VAESRWTLCCHACGNPGQLENLLNFLRQQGFNWEYYSYAKTSWWRGGASL